MALVAMVRSIIVENILQIGLFMQNKANFRRAEMNVSCYLEKDYENEQRRRL